MTKSEIREVAKLTLMHKLAMTDSVARGLSALIRSAMTSKSKAALMEYAELFGVVNHPDFIV